MTKRAALPPTRLDTPCREWLAGMNGNGYGVKLDKGLGKQVLVHRWVVAQILGWEAIEGRVVMHECDNPPCYRYNHLHAGSQAENNADARNKGRGHIIQSHPDVRGERHGRRKLTESDVLEIRASADSGVSLARRFGISNSHIGNIRKRKTWRHL